MNIAIIGCGLIGKKRAENIPKGHKLVAICDTDKNNANKILRENKKVKYFRNWKDIFQNKQIRLYNCEHSSQLTFLKSQIMV